MQPSVIQLLEMTFVGVKVWPQPHELFNSQSVASFDFNDVEIGEISKTYILTEEDDPLTYGVTLRIAIENKKGKVAPYDIDVVVVGHFKIRKSIAKENRENIITVNGCSMLYSAVREQVMMITSRSVHGKLILPTVSFQDKINKNEVKLQENIPEKNNTPDKLKKPKKILKE